MKKSIPTEQSEANIAITEIIAHMLHVEARAIESSVAALVLDEPILLDIHAERQYGNLMRYDLLSYSELLAYFKLRRKLLSRVLAGLSGAQWSRSVQETGKRRKESVYWRARGLALHELEHLVEIENKLKEQEEGVKSETTH